MLRLVCPSYDKQWIQMKISTYASFLHRNDNIGARVFVCVCVCACKCVR